MMNHRTNLLVLLGPTASGKTRLAVDVAEHLQGEIISADSRQVYRGLDIGSGKDLAEYGDIPYHLIDVVNPGYEFSLFDFVCHFCAAFETIHQHRRLPVLVGGTGLYLDAVLQNYRLIDVPEDPDLRRQLADLSMAQLHDRLRQRRPDQHNTTDLEDRQRLVRAIEIAEGESRQDARVIQLPKLVPKVYGLRWPRDILRQRITLRLRQRLASGMIEEVERLQSEGVAWQTLEFYGLEYRFVAHYLQGLINRNDLQQKLNSAIHQFAKRQETWFRRMERRGLSIHWLDAQGDPAAELLADWQNHS